MALDVTGLSTYTDEVSGELVKKMLLEGNTASIVTVFPGVKNAKTINKIETGTLTMAAGACGFSDAGDTDLTQVTLSVDDVKVNQSICLNTLEDYYTSVMMRPGSYNEEIPFEQIFAEEKAEAIGREVDRMFWQGNKAAGSGNLALTNGILYNLDSVVSASTVDVTASALTKTNAIDVVDELIANVPADVINAEDLTLFVSPAEYQVYMTALRNANYFHFGADYDYQNGIIHPGTMCRVRPVTGLVGTTRKVLTPASNLYFGTDLLDDYESFKIFYSQDNDEVRFISKFKLGAAVAWPEYVVVA